MKAILVNRWGDYRLYVNKTPYATTGDSPYKKLSKQNCDDLFGVVDIESFIIEDSKGRTIYHESYELGFKRAMELYQPTEIEVEIEMVLAVSNNNVYYSDIPKLDENGCLILKKI
jgi:hypothetical protein